jgi:alpha-L-fucosidase
MNGDWKGIYAEWYAPDVMYKTWRNDNFYVKNFGGDFEYRDFIDLFKAEPWNP